jgi:hypothetical protein
MAEEGEEREERRRPVAPVEATTVHETTTSALAPGGR